MRSINRLVVLLVAGVTASSVVCLPAQAVDGDASSAPLTDPVDIAAKTLTGYKHVGQKKDYWCGPATAYILISGMKSHGKITTTKSKAHPSWSFSQANLAGNSYLEANGGGGTQRADMRDGLNKWIGRDYFDVLSSPSAAQVKDRLIRNIGSGYGIAVAAYEGAGGRHYNGHPKSKTVDHWIVARGYTTNVASTHFVDPATTVWSGVKPYFSYNTTDFVNRFVKPQKAIVW